MEYKFEFKLNVYSALVHFGELEIWWRYFMPLKHKNTKSTPKIYEKLYVIVINNY